MNYNIIAYSVFIILIILIIVYVGNYFYRNGRIFILGLFKENEAMTDAVNKILLIAYYLFNIGYAFVKLRSWERLRDIEHIISSVSFNMGLLIFILAVTHYFNMYVIYTLSKSKTILFTHKAFQL